MPTNEVAREQMPHYVQKTTAEIGRVAASAVTGPQQNAITRRSVESGNAVTCLMILTSNSLQARLHANPAIAKCCPYP